MIFIRRVKMHLLQTEFKHNGLQYSRKDGAVLVQLVNEKGEYLGLNYAVQGIGFTFTKAFKTTAENGFIFMIDGEVFEKDGIKHTLKDLKKTFKLDKIFGKKITYKIV
jgi:hypothetical protein